MKEAKGNAIEGAGVVQETPENIPAQNEEVKTEGNTEPDGEYSRLKEGIESIFGDEKNAAKEKKDSKEGSAEEEDTSGEEEAKSSEEPKAKPPAQFDREDLLEAGKLGLTAAELEKFSDSASLHAALDILKAKSGDNGAEEAATGDAASEVERYDLKLDPEAYDPEVIQALDGMNKYYAEKLAKVESELNGYKIQATEARFDTMINELGKEWSDIFGKGTVDKLDPKGEQFKNRLELYDEMAALGEGHKALGKRLTETELFKRALRSKFGENAEKIIRKEISQTLEKRKGQMFLSNGAGKPKESGDPIQRATAAVAEKLEQIKQRGGG